MRQRNWPTDRTPVGTMNLATLQFKNELIQTPAFQQLLVIANNSDLSANTRHAIRKLFQDIYRYNSHETNDASWRMDLKNLHINQDTSPELKKVLGELIIFDEFISFSRLSRYSDSNWFASVRIMLCYPLNPWRHQSDLQF
jgi:hypothetical protein